MKNEVKSDKSRFQWKPSNLILVKEKPKQKKTKKAKKTVEFISEEPEIPVIFEA